MFNVFFRYPYYQNDDLIRLVCCFHLDDSCPNWDAMVLMEKLIDRLDAMVSMVMLNDY